MSASVRQTTDQQTTWMDYLASIGSVEERAYMLDVLVAGTHLHELIAELRACGHQGKSSPKKVFLELETIFEAGFAACSTSSYEAALANPTALWNLQLQIMKRLDRLPFWHELQQLDPEYRALCDRLKERIASKLGLALE